MSFFIFVFGAPPRRRASSRSENGKKKKGASSPHALSSSIAPVTLMILRIGRRSDSGRRWAASLPHATATCPSSSTPLEQTSPAMAAATTTANSPRPSLSRSLSCYFSRGFASQPAAVAPDDSCDNQPGFDEDEEVTVNTWLQGKINCSDTERKNALALWQFSVPSFIFFSTSTSP